MTTLAIKILFVIVALINFPRREILRAVKAIYRWGAISISVLFMIVLPQAYSTMLEVFSGAVSYKAALVLFVYIVTIWLLRKMFLSVVDNCTIQLSNRFGEIP